MESIGCENYQVRAGVDRQAPQQAIKTSIANANEIDHKVNDADLDAFMASIPVFETDLVTV